MQISPSFDLEIDFQKGSPTIVDKYPMEVSYRVPGIRFSSKYAGIRAVPNGDYRVGFVQYITRYEFELRYRDTLVEVAVPCPISDSGVGIEYPKDAFSDKSFEKPVDYPWADPPVIFKGNPGGRLTPYTFVNAETTDAPQGSVNWFYPRRTTVPESLSMVDPLESVSRLHHFVTCLVLWNQATRSVVEVLAKAEWEHNISLFTDASRRDGERVTWLYAEPKPVKLVGGLRDFTIPPSALVAPCANEEAPKRWRVSDHPATEYVGFGSGRMVPSKEDLLGRPKPPGRGGTAAHRVGRESEGGAAARSAPRAPCRLIRSVPLPHGAGRPGHQCPLSVS